MPFDHDALGIDLEWAKSLPACQGCRKSSDGAKSIANKDGSVTILCGRHFDEWLARRHSTPGKKISAAEFARELREGPFAPCWAAKIEE